MSTKLNDLFKKFVNKETILYLIFGVVTTVVDFAVYALLIYIFDMGVVSSNIIAWVFAVLVAYITNKLFVFESKSFKFKVLLHELPSFISARLFSLLVSTVFLFFAENAGMNEMIAKLIISVFVVVSNYFFSKLFIFKKDTEHKGNPYLFPCILAFIIPVVILIAIFIGREVYPFGDSIYLRSDCYHQYAPFYKELYRKLVDGGSLTYSWNIGMGVNFSALYSYYLASPINILLGLFAVNGNILLTIDAIIIIKTGLCGLTFAYYLMKHFNTRSYTAAAVSVFYALSSYMAALSWNIMWLDCVVLLPIIALGIEKIVKENKWVTYTLSLGIAIFSNYYIGIMLCIFSVLYFLVMLISKDELKIKDVFVKGFHFAKGSILAGGLGAAMFLPAYFALSYTVSGELEFPEMLRNYFSVFEMLSRSLMNVEVSIFNAHEPNIYCTVAVFIMIPLYCLCSKVKPREKVCKVALMVLMLLSFNLNIPDFIWHGFHFPNSLPARESFIYIFLILVMSYEALLNIKTFTSKQIYGCFFGAVGVILVLEQMFVDAEEYPFEIIYLSLFFILLYLILIMLIRKEKLPKGAVIYMLFVVCLAEAALNSNHEASYKSTGYSYYLKDNDAINNLVSSIEDKDFYRIEKLKRNTKNDAAWNNYPGVSVFSSTANGNITELLGDLGFEKSTNAYSYYGNTPLTSAMLSVRYVISNHKEENPYNMSLVSSQDADNRHLYKMDYCLPLGYMVPSGSLGLMEFTSNDPFKIQNDFAFNTTATENLFSRLEVAASGTAATINVKEESDVYIYITSYLDSISYSASNEAADFRMSGSASDLKHRHILHLGTIPANTIVNVTTTDSSISTLQMYAYGFNEDVFTNVYDKLADEGLNVTYYDDTTIKGTIKANDSGTMLTSIVYDKGWDVFIDGKQIEIGSFEDAFLTVPVNAGEHQITFKYTPDGLHIGIIISVLSLILVIGIYFVEKKYVNKK